MSAVLFYGQQFINWTDETSVEDLLRGMNLQELFSQHQQLDFLYGISSAVLVRELEAKALANGDGDNCLDDNYLNRLHTARKMAIFLANFYQYYLLIPGQVKHYRAEEERLRELYNQQLMLRNSKQQVDCESLPPQCKDPWSVSFKDSYAVPLILRTVIPANWIRLVTQRTLKKLLPTLNGFAGASYTTQFKQIEFFLDPVLRHVVWIFFLPRLLANLFVLFKQVRAFSNEHNPQSDKIQELRVQAAFSRSWFELMTDTVSVVVSLLNACALLGPLIPVSIYLTVGLYAFELFLAGMRAYVELNRLYQLEKELFKQKFSIQKLPDGVTQRQDIDLQLTQLDLLIKSEERRLYTNVGGAAALFLAITMTMPLMAVNPLIPLLGGVLLVAITLVTYAAVKLNEKTKPPMKMEENLSLRAMGFFGVAKQNQGVKKEKDKSQDQTSGSKSEPNTDSADGLSHA